MPLPVTTLYAGLLALLFLVLSVRVVQRRGSAGVSLGDGGDPALNRRIRAHANFAEYVPLLLILLALLENGGTPDLLLHAFGIALLVGRLGHGYALAFARHFPPGRMAGAALSFLALLIGGVGCIWLALQGL
ncbi:MAPEG family protein [Algiphilus sp.]|uniref:MAPEG family protein n=1 Tax=Algiphilus sp. TaxID=1872431 RepID=UPI0025BE4398|nr:MAPEG family protein [Algiphilus sp.]MCK5769975.1 MAPEG family protein [Algiphilus sp.]